jgi:hypothetical protein
MQTAPQAADRQQGWDGGQQAGTGGVARVAPAAAGGPASGHTAGREGPC